MVSSSTNIRPASTRWDSKISFRSSLPVWVASRDKTWKDSMQWQKLCHDTQSSTIKKLGLDDAYTCCSLHMCKSVQNPGQTEEETWAKKKQELRKNGYILWHNCHLTLEPRLWSDTGYCRRSTSTGIRSVHLHWTFAPIAQWHWQRRSRNMPSTKKRSAWPFLSRRKWSQCLPNDRSKSHWNHRLISVDICWDLLFLFDPLHLLSSSHPSSSLIMVKPWNQVATVRIFQRVHNAAVGPSISRACPVVTHTLPSARPRIQETQLETC